MRDLHGQVRFSSLRNMFFIHDTIFFFFSADDLASDFSLQGIPVQSLHGNREQCDREQALDDFKKGKMCSF